MLALHVGGGGVSYASFVDAEDAEKAKVPLAVALVQLGGSEWPKINDHG